MYEKTKTNTAEVQGGQSTGYHPSARWEFPELLENGFVPVPDSFLQLYSKLVPPLTSGEALFVIQLMNFKWDKQAPFPSYHTLAKRMGISDKMARRHAASLESKKYLLRISRIGGTNRFNLSNLFAALANLQHDEKWKDN